ncbi:MAG: acyl-CoA dehydrogenase family protein, partial [Finegoldia magna]|nr:acyl-CoA dehydrogenase family protein [Finegoldia magna]
MNFYEESRKFALEHVEPYAKRSDEEGRFPVESFEEMGKAGYFKLLIPEEMGGLGKTAVEHQQAVLAFAESNPTAGLCYMMHNVALMTVLTNGNEELKKKVVKDIVEN